MELSILRFSDGFIPIRSEEIDQFDLLSSIRDRTDDGYLDLSSNNFISVFDYETAKDVSMQTLTGEELDHFFIAMDYMCWKKLYMIRYEYVDRLDRFVNGGRISLSLRSLAQRHLEYLFLDYSIPGDRIMKLIESRTFRIISKYLEIRNPPPDSLTFITKDVTKINYSFSPNIHLIGTYHLAFLQELDLSYTRVVDAYPFSKIKNLNLAGTRVKDVSMLGYVYQLSLRGCTRIKSFSGLGNNHILDLSWTNIKKASHLGGVSELDLEMTKVTSTKGLQNVKILNLSSTSVENVDNLTNVYNLNVSRTKVTNTTIRALTGVRHLNLSGCENITKINYLGRRGKLITLNIDFTRVKDVSKMGKLKSLSAIGTKIEDFSCIPNVEVKRDNKIQRVTFEDQM